MASIDQTFNNQNFTCLVCLDIWKNSNPQELFCQHTYCFECLNRIRIGESEICCPACYVITEISKEKIKSLDELMLMNFRHYEVAYNPSNICLNHKKKRSFVCKTHKVMNICDECVDGKHKGCEIISIKALKEAMNPIKVLLKTLKNKQENMKKELENREQRTLNEYKIIRETMNSSFKNLKFDVVNDITRYFFDIDKVQNLQKVIKSHSFANIPEMKSFSSSFLMEFQYLFDTFSKISQPVDLNCFIEQMKNFNLSFRQLSDEESKEFKIQLQNNYVNCTPSLLIKVRDEVKNCSDIFFLDKHILSKKDFDNLAKVLRTKFQVEAICIKRNMTMNDGFSNILLSLGESFDILVDLAIINCNLNENQAKNLGKLLKKCKKITTINLSLNEHMKDGFFDVCKGLETSSKTLKNIDFSFCSLDEYQCQFIESLLNKCRCIEKIDLRWNEFMGDGLILIFNSLEFSSNTLKDINLSQCDLTQTYCKKLGDLLNKCPRIDKICLQHNDSMGEGFTSICKGLKTSSKSLKYLDFRNADLIIRQANDLARLLVKCQNLERIFLAKNPDMVSGFLKICESLEKSSNTLKEIDFSDCKFKDSDKGIVESFLKKCSKIEIIHLDWSNITEEKFDVYKCLKGSVHSLKLIDFQCRVWDKQQFRNMERLLKNCKKIEDFGFCHSQSILCSDAALNLHKSLIESRNSLKTIHLGSPLTIEATFSLADLLKYCTCLESITFSLEHEDCNSIKRLVNALKTTSESIREFSLCESENLDQVVDFSDFLKCCRLQSISLPWNRCLKLALQQSTSTLTKISFRGELNEECCRDIGEFLKSCNNIESIYLGDILKSANSLVNIYKGLIKSSNSLKGVSFGIRDLNENQYSKIIELWKNCSNFSKQNINLFFLQNPTIGIGYGILNSTPKLLRFLNLANMNLSESHCKNIANLISCLSQIEYISLEDNRKMGNGIIDICHGLKNSTQTLKKINFENTNLNENQCVEFGKLLSLCSIEMLLIGKNENISNGFLHIFRGLCNSWTSLRTLNLGFCYNASEQVKFQLASLMKECSQLKDVNLAGLKFTDKEIGAICQGLKKSSETLTRVNFKSCNLSEKQAILLSIVFSKFSTLKRLHLEDNDNMGEGLYILCNKVCDLEYSLRNIDLGTETMKRFDHYIQQESMNSHK